MMASEYVPRCSSAVTLTKPGVLSTCSSTEAANGLISQTIFMFEYNVRHGTVIGIVGAGGIGYYINLYLRFLQYDKVVAYLIIIFVAVLLLDQASILARSVFTDERDVQRPPWWSVLLPAAALPRPDDDE